LATAAACLIEVVGAAGIGKTRLLADVAARADARGHIVLRGAASELERDIAFWVFIEALDEYVESAEPRRLAGLSEEVRAELALVFPSLAHLGNADAVRLQGERYRINRAVRELLERLAATKPLVLILDDFHWADPASVDLAGSLLRRPPSAPVLLVMAARPHQGSTRLAGLLERALRERTLSRIELHPLTGDEAAQMLGRAGPDPTTAALFEESGGNPFYLEQLARSPELADRLAGVPRMSVGGVHVPPLVLTALAEELALLSKRARRVLEGASVAGDPFEPEMAAIAADVEEQQTMEALDELLAADIVRATDVPRRFRFRHPIVRRAVYESAPGGWRIGAHERAAEALMARGADAGTRAHHVDISAKTGDAAALATLVEAGRISAPRAPAIAVRWFSGALRLLPDNAPFGERIELLLANATSLAATGRFEDAHEAILQGLAIVPAEETALRLKLSTTCARVEHLLGRHHEAHTRLLTALESLPDEAGAEAVGLMIELARDAVFHLQYTAGHQWAARAVAASRALDDPLLIAVSYAISARALAWGGNTKDGDAMRSEAAALIDALPDDELARRLDAVVDLAGAEIYLDRFAEAARHSERALRVGRATGQDQLFPGINATLGVAWCMLGRLTEAAELLETAIEAGRLSGNPQALAWALFCRAFVALPAGDIQVAITTAEESLNLATAGGQSVIAARAAAVLAIARITAGEPARLTETLGDPANDPFHALPDTWRAYFHELMTRYWLARGNRDAAERCAASARSSSAAVGLRLPTAMAYRAAAAVALADDDARAAADQALASADLAEAVGAPIEAGLARLVAGRALARLGQRDRAIKLLEQAAAELDLHGAARYRDEAQQELRRLGKRIHRRTRPGDPDQTGIATLTARELEIARLIVDRKTNGEIASQLFLSRKTVETHIRNMFRKLDANSRVDIARTVEKADQALVDQ
jgi:DNA-binding CsgD family transcriptional regulator/tetratricopeptide (TPR) repeat protein